MTALKLGRRTERTTKGRLRTLKAITMATLMVMSMVVWKEPAVLAGWVLGGHAGAVMVILSSLR
jgi:hypothetical protein